MLWPRPNEAERVFRAVSPRPSLFPSRVASSHSAWLLIQPRSHPGSQAYPKRSPFVKYSSDAKRVSTSFSQ
jgi:hypothetical protein